VAQVHVHGHASQEELKLLLNLVKPRFFMPVHGEYRHLSLHARLAQSLGIPEKNTFLLEDGDVLDISGDEADAWLQQAIMSRGLLKKLSEFTARDYDVDRWRRDIEGDLVFLREIHRAILSARRQPDPKLEEFVPVIADELSRGNVPVKIELKTGEHKGITLHKLTAPLPEGANDAARKIFGDNVNVSIGTSPKAIYLSVGKTAEASLKKAIDGVVSNPTSAADSLKMRMSLSQLLNFIQSIEPNPVVDGMLSSLSSGDDQVMMDSQLIERGSVTRVTIQEGVLKAVSGGVQAGMAAQGGGF